MADAPVAALNISLGSLFIVCMGSIDKARSVEAEDLGGPLSSGANVMDDDAVDAGHCADRFKA